MDLILILVFALFGFFAGIITGLIPGLHVNNFAFIALALFINSEPEFSLLISIFIISMSLTSSFIEFIPNLLLFLPDSDNFLSILPGQKMFLQGKAFQAVYLTAFAGLVSGVISIIIFYPLLFFFDSLWFLVKDFIWVLLVIVLILMVFEKKSFKEWFFTLIIVLLSGFLGLVSFEFLFIDEPLFSLIAGFFGISAILNSLESKGYSVKQSLDIEPIDFLQTIKLTSISLFAGLFIALMPGVSPALTALILSQMIGTISSKEFLFVIGSVSMTNFVFSFGALISIEKARSGAALAISNLIVLTQNEVILIMGISLIIIPLAFLTCLFLSKKLINELNKINLRPLLIAILLFQLVLVFFFSGFLGLVVSFLALIIAFLAADLGVKRSTCMSCIMLPMVIRFF